MHPAPFSGPESRQPPPGDGRRRFRIALVPLAAIRQTEEVDELALKTLTQKIARERRWTDPIWLERRSLAVMDGNHRLNTARHLGLRRVPCLLLDYGLVQLRVECWTTGRPLDGSSVISAGLSGNLLPHKSTRHSLDTERQTCSMSLESLR